MTDIARVIARPSYLGTAAAIGLCLTFAATSCSSTPVTDPPGTGGATNTGGSSATGGNASTGGSSATGGNAPTGGASSTGGSATGGTKATGGAGTGGSTGGSVDAGTPATGGSTGQGGSAVPGRSAGCGKTSTMTFGTVPNEQGKGYGTGGYVTITSSGEKRGFAMRLPDNYDNNKPSWLIFGFHWNGGSSADVDSGGSNGYSMAHFGLQKLSNNGAFFVAPQGNGNGWANPSGHDLTFVDDMVKLIEDNYCIDTTHIITNGFSYGGGMSYELACARAKVFRAAAIYEGAQLSGCDGGNDPIALWQMVGLDDNVCGMGSATPIRDRFVKNNKCTTQNPPQPNKAPPYTPHVCTNYAGCSAGHPLRWCVHQSGHGNAIVDGSGDLYNSCATAPKTCSTSCPCTWVPQDVWSFLTAL